MLYQAGPNLTTLDEESKQLEDAQEKQCGAQVQVAQVAQAVMGLTLRTKTKLNIHFKHLEKVA